MIKELYHINKAFGITVNIQATGNITIDGCVITRNKQQLNFEKKFSGLSSIDDLDKYASNNLPLALNLSGKGILTKQIKRINEVSSANFNLILPNANFEDFYIQNAISGTNSFVSLIRKTDADKWFDQLVAIGHTPVMLSLGPFPILNIIRELNIYGDTIIVNGHHIMRSENGDWLSYHYNTSAKAEFKLKIQNEAINESIVMPYAAAFQLILYRQIDAVKTQAKPYDELFTLKQSDLKFRVNALMILGVFFILLLGNFLLLSWLDSSNAELNARLSKTLQNSNDIKVSSDQIKEKESILEGLGWDSNISKSAIIDQIAAVLPADVEWTEVNINPVDVTASQQGKSLIFLSRCIKVTGLSEKVLSVNEWIARIKIKPWVKNVRLENFTFSNELNTGVYTVNIIY